MLLKFYLLRFVSMVFSHLLNCLILGLFHQEYLNIPTAQSHKTSESARILECISIPKIMVTMAFVANLAKIKK